MSLKLPKAKVPTEGENLEEKAIPKNIQADGGERIFDNIIQLSWEPTLLQNLGF